MSRGGAWVSSASGQAKASQQATRPAIAGAGHRAALDHSTGQAVATSSRTRSTPQRRLIRGRGLALARTQPLALALAIGHRTHPKGRQATPKGSAAPPIRGQRGGTFRGLFRGRAFASVGGPSNTAPGQTAKDQGHRAGAWTAAPSTPPENVKTMGGPLLTGTNHQNRAPAPAIQAGKAKPAKAKGEGRRKKRG